MTSMLPLAEDSLAVKKETKEAALKFLKRISVGRNEPARS